MGKDALFHTTLYTLCNNLFMLCLKLIHFGKKGPFANAMIV